MESITGMSLAVAEQWTYADCVTAVLSTVALSQTEMKAADNICLFIQVLFATRFLMKFPYK
jgi:hypothetical protein